MKINSILLMLSLVACGACTDFLEESDPSNFTQENYFQRGSLHPIKNPKNF